jgi:acyl-CoA dehydrogenase
VGAFIRNVGRSVGLGLTQGRWAKAPVSGPIAPYYRKLSWASATFAVLTDVALIRYGGSLKRHENLTGRYADALSWLYLTSAVLRRFEAEGRPDADLATVQWAAQYGLVQIQTAFEGIVSNLSFPVVGPLLKPFMGLGLRLNPLAILPTDALGHQVAKDLQRTGEMRDRLTAGIYLPTDPTDALGRLEQAHTLSQQADTIHRRLKDNLIAGQISTNGPKDQTESLETLAHRAGLLTQTEWDLLKAADQARKEAIQVDAFTFEEYEAGSTVNRVLLCPWADAPL